MYKMTIGISIHPPHAGRDAAECGAGKNSKDFNPPSPCGEGRDRITESGRTGLISIHPPHAGRDSTGILDRHPEYHFNPPSPCGEGLSALCALENVLLFQSTLPMRGGTVAIFQRICVIVISIHPPHAGRDGA